MKHNWRTALGRSGRNLLLSLGSEAAVRATGLAVLILLARYLGPTEFGRYNTLLAFYMLAVTLGNFGLDRLATRELVRAAGSVANVFSTLLRLRLAAGAVTAVVLVLVGALVKPDAMRFFAVLALALLPNAFAASFVSAFHARHDFGPPSWATGVAAVAGLTATTAGLAVGAPLMYFIVVILGSELLRAAWLAIAGWRVGFRGREPASAEWALRALRGTLPYGLLVVLAAIYFRIDLILLDALVGGAVVGHYAGAFRILEAAAALPLMILAVLFPRFVHLQRLDRDAARSLYLAVVPLIGLLGIGVAVTGALLAEPLLTLLFSSDYAVAATALVWLMFAAVPLFLQVVNTTVLLAGEQLRSVVLWYALTLMFKIALAAVLVPRFAATGAAAATAISEMVSLVVFTHIVRRRLGIPLDLWLGSLVSPRRSLQQLDLLLDRPALLAEAAT